MGSLCRHERRHQPQRLCPRVCVGPDPLVTRPSNRSGLSQNVLDAWAGRCKFFLMYLSWFLLAVALAAAGGPSSAKSGGALACDFAGSYRFRFLSNGHDGWWFRFNVDGTPAKATLVENVEVLALKAGRLDMTADPTQCKLTLRTKGKSVGQLVITIVLDTKANSFKGKLTRTKATDVAEQEVTINGIRDVDAQQTGDSCVVPGIYRIDFDPKARWRNSDKGDKRSCKRPEDWAQPVFVRVEPFGATLAISKVDSEPPYAEVWAIDSAELHGDCEVSAKISNSELELDSRLTFAKDRVTGIGVKVNQQVYEDEGNIWNCVAKKFPLSVTRVR